MPKPRGRTNSDTSTMSARLRPPWEPQHHVHSAVPTHPRSADLPGIASYLHRHATPAQRHARPPLPLGFVPTQGPPAYRPRWLLLSVKAPPSRYAFSATNPDLATKAAKSSKLLDLPPELVEMSLDLIRDERDLRALRLVCKTTAGFTRARMLSTCYADIHILLSVRRSLLNALRIAKHPVLGKAVRCVRIYECTLSREAFDDIRFPGDDAVSLKASRFDIHPHRETRLQYFKLLEDQEWMVATGEDVEHLTEIFRSLASANRTMNLVIEDCHGKANHPRAKSAFERTFGVGMARSTFFRDVWADDRTLSTVLSAIQRSDLRLKEFEAAPGRFAVPWKSSLDANGFAGTFKNFEGLTSLSLSFGDVRSTGDAAIQSAEVDGFLGFLQHLSPSLQDLQLSWQRRRGPHASSRQFHELCTRMCQTLTFPKLRILDMLDFQISYSPFVMFLGRHTSRLRYYRLDGELLHFGLNWPHAQRLKALRDDLKAANFPLGNGTLQMLIHR